MQVDRCKTASDVWAARAANHAWRLKMFARPVLAEPDPEPIEAEPIDIPMVLPKVRWTGFQWIGDFNLLVRQAYPRDYKRPSINEIIKRCAEIGGVRVNDIISARRTTNLILPRHVAMALAKHFTLQSLPEIGRRFGGRDHTTVLHAIRKMEPVIHAVERMLPANANLTDWVIEALAFARANDLESVSARRARLARLKAPLMVPAE